MLTIQVVMKMRKESGSRVVLLVALEFFSTFNCCIADSIGKCKEYFQPHFYVGYKRALMLSTTE